MTIYRHSTKGVMQETIAHEIAHVVYRYFIDNKQRSLWGKWYRERRQQGKELITSYARENEEEDFCENFAILKTDPDELSMFGAKEFDFIKSIYSSLPA